MIEVPKELFDGKISYDTYIQLTENKILKNIKVQLCKLEKH